MKKAIIKSLSGWCGRYSGQEQANLEVLQYGLGLCIDTLVKITVILLIGAAVGKEREFLAVTMVMALFRAFAGGVHARTSLGCFFYMLFFCSISVGAADFLLDLPMNCYYAGLAVLLILAWRFAPLESIKNPVHDKKLLFKKKIWTMIVIAVSTIVSGCCSGGIKWAVMLILFTEISLISIFSMKRREQHEKQI